jgi:putative MATE family efflux protein
MRVRVTSRHIWAVSLPVIFAGLSETIVEVTDIVFLGRYGTTELAAIGLADAIYSICLFLTLGLVDGIQIVIARRAGQGRTREIGSVFNQGLYLLILVAAVFVVLLKGIAPVLTASMIRSADVARAVEDFLQIFAFAMFFHGVNLALSAFYVGISRTRALIGGTLVLAIVNIFLDYALIFGHFGFPELGIRGAAIGSLSAEIAAFIYLVLHALVRRYDRRYGLFHLARWNQSLTRKLLSISSPVALDALVETLRWFAFFLIIEHLGEEALACANIVFSCYALLLIPVDGFSETTCSMVSNLVGQDRSGQIGRLLRRTISLGYAVVLPLLALVLLVPETVLSLFTSDPDLIATSQNSLRVIVVVVAIVVPADMFYNAVAGTGDTTATLGIEVSVTVCILGLAYWFAMRLGLPLESVWVAEAVGWVLCLLLSSAWLQSRRWERLRF